MAAIAPTINYSSGDQTLVATWANVTEGDTFVSLGGGQYMDYADRNVQIIGTFGSATVVVNGSNDNSNFAPLTDPQGNAISKTAAALEQITENTLFVKPTHSGGTSESVTVIMVMRRNRAS